MPSRSYASRSNQRAPRHRSATVGTRGAPRGSSTFTANRCLWQNEKRWYTPPRRSPRSTPERQSSMSIAVRGSSRRKLMTAGIVSARTTTNGCFAAGSHRAMASPCVSASRLWISSGFTRRDSGPPAALCPGPSSNQELLFPDLLLDEEKRLCQRLRSRRAPRDIHVHGDDLVDPAEHRVGVREEAARVGARAHGDHVLRVRHLLVEKPDARRHLERDGAGDDDEVALARRRPRDRAEAVEVSARPSRLHQLDRAAREAEQKVPKGRQPAPVEQLVDGRREDRVGERPIERHGSRPLLREPLLPLEIALRPDVHEPEEEDQDEDEDLGEGEGALPRLEPAAKNGRHGEHKRDLDVEDDEDESDQVEAKVELDPGISDGALAALVRDALLGLGDIRPQEAAEEEAHEDKPDPDADEHQHVGEIEQHRCAPGGR